MLSLWKTRSRRRRAEPPTPRRYIITISDKQMDYDMNFMAYFITRLPNPSFSPELQAKTTVVDFTVTQKGALAASRRVEAPSLPQYDS